MDEYTVGLRTSHVRDVYINKYFLIQIDALVWLYIGDTL